MQELQVDFPGNNVLFTSHKVVIDLPLEMMNLLFMNMLLVEQIRMVIQILITQMIYTLHYIQVLMKEEHIRLLTNKGFPLD